MAGEPRVTPFGKLISLLLVLGVVAVGIYMVKGKSSGSSSETSKEAEDGPAEVSELQLEVPRLAPAAAHQLKDNTVPIEISEYAGYAGLIAANGGLNPSENSVFFRNGGFKVKLTVSEEESWSALNSGALAGSVTTTDVLAVYGRQFQVVVPAQIGFSRGADGLVVRSDINRVNALRGKVIAAAQFTEVDFFIRYLAQEAGLAVQATGQSRCYAGSEQDQPGLHRRRIQCRRSFSPGSRIRTEQAGRLRHLGAQDL